VVATDVGGVRELMGDAGAIVPAKDSRALAEAMVAMMRRPAEARIELGRVARERICSRFSMDWKADEWEALYLSVLGGGIRT
jgi:glycosyltransferase involved in cell wall biosynthesis